MTTIKTFNDWKKEILRRESEAGINNLKYVYIPDAVMTHDTATSLEKYFLDMGYTIELNKCYACTNKYDIILDVK